MNIVFDCRCVHDHMGGIGQAARQLVREVAGASRGHRLLVLVGPRAPKGFDVPGAGLIAVQGAMIDERFEQLELPTLLERVKTDVYINPTFSVPAVKTSRFQIAFLHDVVFEDHPEWVEAGLRAYLRRWSRLSAAAADQLITVSDFSRSRIQAVYGVPVSRLTRIYNGLATEFLGPCTDSELKRTALKYGLRSPYILYLGSLEPKKGIPELLQAFAEVSRSGSPELLMLAGEAGKWGSELDAHVGRLGLKGRVVFAGYVDETDRKPLLAGARLFVYPSLYEGFGLPPLEAMSLGIPCVVHQGTSLPEVVGDVGLVTDVRDQEGFARALRRGLTDVTFRLKAAEAGPSRARSFSWKAAADQIVDLCERLDAAA